MGFTDEGKNKLIEGILILEQPLGCEKLQVDIERIEALTQDMDTNTYELITKSGRSFELSLKAYRFVSAKWYSFKKINKEDLTTYEAS